MGDPGATYGSVALVQPGTAPSRRRIEAVHSTLLVGCFALVVVAGASLHGGGGAVAAPQMMAVITPTVVTAAVLAPAAEPAEPDVTQSILDMSRDS